MVTTAQVQTQLAAEIVARKAADADLSARITNEVNARSLAVNSLDARLDIVEPAVTALTSRVDKLEARVTALETPTTPPPIGFTDLPGWKLVFADEFNNRTIPFGSFASTSTGQYGMFYSTDGMYLINPPSWTDTSKGGQYNPNNISVHDGVLDCLLRTVSGVPQVTCIKPLPAGCDRYTAGITGPYRYHIRMKADKAAGYKAVIVNWATLASGGGVGDMLTYGEIDHPEGDLDSTPKAYMHRYQGASSSDQDYFVFPPSVTWADYHDYVLEFVPGVRCTIFVDNTKIAEITSRVPKGSPFRINLQFETETDQALPDPTVVGHVYVDRLAVWTPTG